MPVELTTLTDARGEPMGEWAAEPIPGTRGRWVRLIVLRANEWSPAVRAGREEEVARAVAALDLELALFPDAPARPGTIRCGAPLHALSVCCGLVVRLSARRPGVRPGGRPHGTG